MTFLLLPDCPVYPSQILSSFWINKSIKFIIPPSLYCAISSDEADGAALTIKLFTKTFGTFIYI